MAAFSYQYQPFLVDSSSCFSIINTSLPPHHFQIHHHQELTEPSFTNNQDQDQDQETSCVDQTSKVGITSDTTTDFSVVKNQSPESSMVVEKGEQVTQKLIMTSTPMAMEKKRRNRNNIGSSLSSPCLSKDSTEGVGKKQKKNSGTGVKGEKEEKKKSSSSSSSDDEEPPTDYIHVRARRGQATDSHSLAERVRREKISERMKVLQQLVPGCDRVTGKALVLDEIINYVQSLQNQVEFLSMKLASVNPIFFDMAIDLDTLLVTPDQKSNSIAPPIIPPPCSNHATANFNFDDATTLMTTTTTTNSFPAANNDYLLDYSSSVFLQGQRSNNNFLEHTGGPFWDTEDQRQRFLNPYGFGNNTRSLN